MFMYMYRENGVTETYNIYIYIYIYYMSNCAKRRLLIKCGTDLNISDGKLRGMVMDVTFLLFINTCMASAKQWHFIFIF